MRTIDAVIKDAFDALPELKSFGVAPKSYSNVLEGEMPRLWLHNVSTVDTVTSSGAQSREYTLLMDLHTYHPFGENMIESRVKLQTLDAIFVRLLDRICSDDRLASFPTNIRREEHYNELDHNLIGYAVTMNIKLREGLAYFCESITTSYYMQGYINDGYFVKE